MKIRLSDSSIPVLTLSDAPRHPLFAGVEADTAGIRALAARIAPDEANVYVRDDPDLRAAADVQTICRTVFGELPIQAGWCYGGCRDMNGMEWHKSSEVVAAATECVLLLGSYADVHDDTFDSAHAVALHLFPGETVELMPMTLHLAPLPTGERFCVAILLPDGTNAPLDGGIDGALRAVNKWLLLHPENKTGIALGGKIGVCGQNIRLLREESHV